MSAVVVTKKGGMAQAAPLAGGAISLSPNPIVGGRRRKMTKKMRKMLKALKKLKGGEVEGAVAATETPAPVATETPAEEGGRRRRSRKTRRRSRRGLFY